MYLALFLWLAIAGAGHPLAGCRPASGTSLPDAAHGRWDCAKILNSSIVTVRSRTSESADRTLDRPSLTAQFTAGCAATSPPGKGAMRPPRRSYSPTTPAITGRRSCRRNRGRRRSPRSGRRPSASSATSASRSASSACRARPAWRPGAPTSRACPTSSRSASKACCRRNSPPPDSAASSASGGTAPSPLSA